MSPRHGSLDKNPYHATELSVLADSLEAQYDRGEPLDADMVFEVLDRLSDAERKLRKHRERKQHKAARARADEYIAATEEYEEMAFGGECG